MEQLELLINKMSLHVLQKSLVGFGPKREEHGYGDAVDGSALWLQENMLGLQLV